MFEVRLIPALTSSDATPGFQLETKDRQLFAIFSDFLARSQCAATRVACVDVISFVSFRLEARGRG